MILKEIIKELKQIDKVCEEANYSLDTAYRLENLSKKLHKQAVLTQECCYQKEKKGKENENFTKFDWASLLEGQKERPLWGRL